MRVLFVGPTLAVDPPDFGDIEVRPPARQGDIYAATLDGAAAIGIIDGVFGDTRTIWHKEILYALTQGVRVIGGASLGALRAAECAEFGMEPVGEIAKAYLDGTRRDDADVCLAHCPAELGFLPLSEPLVDVEATVRHLHDSAAISTPECEALLHEARNLYFADRTLDTLIGIIPEARRAAILTLYRQHAVRAKRRDGLAVLARLRDLPPHRAAPPSWQLAPSRSWTLFMAEMAADQATIAIKEVNKTGK